MSSFLKLAVDGRNLTSSISGINRYVSESVFALSAGNISIDILHHRPVQQYFLDYLKATNVTFHQTATRFSFPLYTPTGEDVFWGPAHRFPINFPKHIPALVTIHDLVWKKYAATMNRRTYLGERLFFAKTLNRANKIVCSSHSTAYDLQKYFPNYADKVDVIYPGAHQPSCRSRHAGKPFALFVGTMEPRKNLYRLINAYAAMPCKNAIDLVIAGGVGWGGINPDMLVTEYGLKNHVRIIKGANNSVINQLYADCHFLVMPSLYEGFGLPLVEAMKYGKPVVTSNIASMPEVAGAAGLLIDPNDTQQISQAMAELSTNQDLHSNLSSFAVKRSKYFSWEKTSHSLIDCFQTLKHS